MIISFLDVLNVVGTAAFAVSGALVAIKNKLDLFGIFVLAVITASGGGLIRDVILHIGLPVFFRQPYYLSSIVLSTIITCLAFKPVGKLYFIIKIFDAVGLGVFTILTAYACIILRIPMIGVVFIAVLAGIGGGILRDILVNDVPLVFKTEIYALASILGAICFYILYGFIDISLNVYLSISIIFIIRMISVYFKINLPVISNKSDNTR